MDKFYLTQRHQIIDLARCLAIWIETRHEKYYVFANLENQDSLQIGEFETLKNAQEEMNDIFECLCDYGRRDYPDRKIEWVKHQEV